MSLEINDNNVHANDRFRRIVQESFSGALEMLGSKDFARWLQTRKIDRQLKVLII